MNYELKSIRYGLFRLNCILKNIILSSLCVSCQCISWGNEGVQLSLIKILDSNRYYNRVDHVYKFLFKYWSLLMGLTQIDTNMNFIIVGWTGNEAIHQIKRILHDMVYEKNEHYCTDCEVNIILYNRLPKVK